ncbi:surface lipoprotein assembly modifier [Novosphingobium sp. RL4]|uniref:surface lipoprotein assembly modifier n=1 Tax=Novosphingobium sp. RL4 TaxID=3109595 RepID=UPI002D772115|nr:surface lipoprotein assembly modifier [Novosphingobium sp. RL4]WRT95485.1 surface lipoprotein assembly modifier [Novosphingobium sp. RL4]
MKSGSGAAVRPVPPRANGIDTILMAAFRKYLLLLCAGMPLGTPPAVAQSGSGQDTRLRLDQQIDRQQAQRDAEAREDAEALDEVPSSMVIDGETYAVGNNASDLGQALYISVSRKQWRDVRRFLAAYRKLEDRDPMLELYALGALARSEGKLAQAERDYRALLDLKPDFLPGQLELARTLFENRKDREAARIFRAARLQVAGGGPQGEGVLRSIDAFLSALKTRQGWQGSLALGPGYSTNLNQSSASYTCLLAADDGTCLIDRKVPDAIASTGINIEGTLSRRIALGGHGGLRARVMLFGDIYPEHHAYSQTTAIMRLGYDYQTARDGVAISPSFDLGTFGSSILYTAWGVNAEWTHTLSPRALFKLEGNYRRFDYALAGYDTQDGGLADLFLTGWYTLPHGWTLLGGPDALDKSAGDPVDAYRQLGARLGVAKSFGSAASLLLLGSARERRYRAYSELFEAKRRDREQVYTAILRVPALRLAGLVPEALVQHNRVKSNIDWLYSYRRTTVSLRLSRSF